ncbi:RNB domain-containing ribonuclease [Actinopolyspora halophila]|uniref:RNB domain-containing ribonuclease n=1 Tax=Actinopolyspora halophila TaxID=1850 RepID=UPI00037B5832
MVARDSRQVDSHSRAAARADVAADPAGPVDTDPVPSEGTDFTGIRREFGLPFEFPVPALTEAEQTAVAFESCPARSEATGLPLVTVDPPGAKDLDQAVLLERTGRGGFRVRYAVADMAVFVPPGGELERETLRRGQSLYLPDGVVPLHPTLLSESAASLLPEQVRPAMLWTIELDDTGTVVRVDLRRATVRSVAALDYESVLRSFEAGAPHPSLAPLPEVGELLRERTMHRGAIELGLPEQRVELSREQGWRLGLRSRTWPEVFNAELSLLTGMCAAEIMLSAGVGVLRTVPEPEEAAVARLRRSAERLGIHWTAEQGPAEFLAGLDPRRPESLALHVAGTGLLRGAGYTAFSGDIPSSPSHAGIGAAYAHVTAPLRRLVDRFCAEMCLAVVTGSSIPGWVSERIEELPSVMGNSDRLATRVERACVAQVQSWELTGRVGESFTATVLRTEPGGQAGEVFVGEPPVIARCVGTGLVEGSRVPVRLAEVDPARRRVLFEVANHTPALSGAH